MFIATVSADPNSVFSNISTSLSPSTNAIGRVFSSDTNPPRIGGTVLNFSPHVLSFFASFCKKTVYTRMTKAKMFSRQETKPPSYPEVAVLPTAEICLPLRALRLCAIIIFSVLPAIAFIFLFVFSRRTIALDGLISVILSCVYHADNHY